MLSKNKILLLTILLLTMAELNVTVIAPTIPSLIVHLSTTMTAIQTTIVMAMLSFGLGLLIWGPLSDAFGRRFVALSGMSLFVLGGIWCTQVNTIEGLMIGRMLQGFGISCAGAVAPVIPKDIFSGARLLKAFALISIAMAITPIIAQLTGGFLQEHWGWKSNFRLLALYGGFITWLLWQFLPETNPRVTKKLPAVSELFSRYWHILKDKPFWGYVACLSFIFAGEMLYVIVVPFMVQNQLGYTPTQHGGLSLITCGGLLLGATLSTRLSQHRQENELIQLGLLFSGISAVIMLLLAWFVPMSLWTLILPVGGFMIGAGLIYPNCIAGIMNRFETTPGVAGALMSTLQMLGAAMIDSAVVAAQITEVNLLAWSYLASVLAAIVLFYWAVLRVAR